MMTDRPWVLMNPGPVNVTSTVRRSLTGPDLCHREPEFSTLLKSIRRRLLDIFGIRKTHTAAIISGSGTAALEAMLASYAAKDRKVLVLSNGVYGERMRQILEIHGSPVRILRSDLGSFPTEQEVKQTLRSDKQIRAVAMVHHETSTGMLNPADRMVRIAKAFKKTVLIDGVSSLGAEKLDIRTIDLCAGSAGKCLHGHPGVSFVLVSKKARALIAQKKPNTLYLDLSNTLDYEEANDTPFTPAVPLFYSFEQALKELQKEGLQKRVRRYAARSAALEKGFSAQGLEFLVPKKYRSHVLTSLWMPKATSYAALHRRLKERGFIIYAGQSKLAGRIFRVSNLGEMSSKDISRFLDLLRKACLPAGRR